MNLFRTMVATVRLWKYRVLRYWTTDDPDCFTLLEWFYVLAGVRFDSQNGCCRLAWNLYRVVRNVQMLITLVGCISTLVTDEDPLKTIWSVIMFVSEVMCQMKHYLVLRHDRGVKELRQFLGTENFDSGDWKFDETARNRFQKRSSKVILALGTLVVIQQVGCWIPNRQQLRTFYIPPWIGEYFGQGLAIFLQVIYISCFALFWVSRLFCCTIVSTILMMGMQAELEILVNHFGQLEVNLKDLRDKYHDSEQSKQQYWERLKILMKTPMDRQILLLRNLRKLQSLVETLFFYIYYFAILSVGSAFFIILSEPLSFMHFVIGATVMLLSLECYLTSYLVESLKNIFSSISDHMFTICSQLPYSVDYRRDYLAMRTTLMTVAHCSLNMVKFGCPGISDISVIVFTQLMNTSYSVLTFLLNVI